LIGKRPNVARVVSIGPQSFIRGTIAGSPKVTHGPPIDRISTLKPEGEGSVAYSAGQNPLYQKDQIDVGSEKQIATCAVLLAPGSRTRASIRPPVKQNLFLRGI
jgi:hypothetical protein